MTISSVGAGVLGMVRCCSCTRACRRQSGGHGHRACGAADRGGRDGASGIGHGGLGLLGNLLLGSLPGIYLGSHLSVKVPERVLRPVLAAMLMLIGGRLLWA